MLREQLHSVAERDRRDTDTPGPQPDEPPAKSSRETRTTTPSWACLRQYSKKIQMLQLNTRKTAEWMRTSFQSNTSPTLSSRAELGPCNMAQRQPSGGGHLQPILPSPPRGHAVWRAHEDSVVFELNQRTLSQ
ncbi:hypothetical protein KUCAC02_006989 [Chaenocephalus aceratus]|nr:hypothetical protein KUCAC02_006989 [Chaenocephalus aceratus]